MNNWPSVVWCGYTALRIANTWHFVMRSIPFTLSLYGIAHWKSMTTILAWRRLRQMLLLRIRAGTGSEFLFFQQDCKGPGNRDIERRSDDVRSGPWALTGGCATRDWWGRKVARFEARQQCEGRGKGVWRGRGERKDVECCGEFLWRTQNVY